MTATSQCQLLLEHTKTKAQTCVREEQPRYVRKASHDPRHQQEPYFYFFSHIHTYNTHTHTHTYTHTHTHTHTHTKQIDRQDENVSERVGYDWGGFADYF